MAGGGGRCMKIGLGISLAAGWLRCHRMLARFAGRARQSNATAATTVAAAAAAVLTVDRLPP